MTRFTTLLLLIFSTFSGVAQFKRSSFVPYSTISVGGGASLYYGDLIPAPYRDLLATAKMARWNGGISYTKYISPQLGVRTSFNWIRIAGDDYTVTAGKVDKEGYAGRMIRNLHFRNDLKEFSLSGIYNFTSSGRIPQKRPKIQPYAFIGIGLIAHNPQARLPTATGEKQNWVSLSQYDTEAQGQTGYPKKYSLVQPVVPFGMGIKLKVRQKIDVVLEGGFRYTPTDYLDDVSEGAYPNPADLSGPTAVQLANRTQEQFAARTGEDRTTGLIQALETYGITGVANPFALPMAGYNIAGTRRGSNKFDDMYFVAQLSVSYLINQKIKCPPMK